MTPETATSLLFQSNAAPPLVYHGASIIKETRMSASEIAKRHFQSAMDETKAAGEDSDGVCRAILGLVVAKYLETRAVADVQSELQFLADNCDPDTDFAFMRP
jgi:hypothetical protein